MAFGEVKSKTLNWSYRKKSQNWYACGGCFHEIIDDSEDGKPIPSFSNEKRYAYKASSEDEFEEDKLPKRNGLVIVLFENFCFIHTSSSLQALPPPVEALLRFFWMPYSCRWATSTGTYVDDATWVFIWFEDMMIVADW